jgi:hypothetical protein
VRKDARDEFGQAEGRRGSEKVDMYHVGQGRGYQKGKYQPLYLIDLSLRMV